MDISTQSDDRQVWFQPGPQGGGRCVAVIADHKHRSVFTDRIGDGSSIEICFIPANEPVSAGAARTLSDASATIVVLDANGPLLQDVWQHVSQAIWFGPSRLILAVDGADDKAAYDRLCAEFAEVAGRLGVEQSTAVPMTDDGKSTAGWYDGPQLHELLAVAPDSPVAPLRALVSKAQSSSKQISCQIVAGQAGDGDAVKIVPGGRQLDIVSADLEANGSDAVLTISGPADVRYGDVICAAGDPVVVSDQFEANITWFGPEPMLPGRPYVMKFAAGVLDGTLAIPKFVIQMDTQEHLAAKTLEPGDIGVCNLSLEADVPFTPFQECRALGGFTVIDKFSDEVVGAGAVNFALRRASNIHWQALDLDKAVRAGKLGQKSSVLWFTGLSGSGKSTIANLVEKKLHAIGHQTYLLDGDNVRHGLNRDLGFTDADRVENIRRVAEVSRLMADAGLIVLVSFISPFRSERRMARDMMEDGEFIEVHVDTPLDVCEQRDVKGLYVKARRGEIKNFTGIDSDYELPERADIVLDTTVLDAERSADEIIAHLDRGGRLKP